MKNKLFTALFISLTVAFSVPKITPAHSIDDVQFICDTSKSIPVTYILTSKENIEFIGWESQAFLNSGYSPKLRCQIVSARLQRAWDAQTMRYMTTGKMNGQKVICFAKTRDSGCTPGSLLITLEYKDNPNKVLVELVNVQTRKQKVRLSRGGKPIYIDVEAYLSNIGNRRQFQPIKKKTTHSQPTQTEPTNSDDNCHGSFFCN